jgi:Putative adhesin
MRRSISGPILLLAIGGLFLWRNLHPEAPIFEILAQYWPFVLIAWGLLRLIEALIWRENGVRGSFSGGEVVLIIMICIAGSGIWTAREHGVRFMNGGLDFWGQQYDYPVSATAPATGMKRLVFENPRGSIKVTGGDAKEVSLTGHKQIRAYRREEADATNGSTQVEIVPQGDHLLVRTNEDRIPNNQRMSCDLEVTVPRGMAVESRSSNGDHEVNDVDGDVEITSSHGDVRLSRIGGNVRLDISRSDLIRATDVKGRIDLQGRGSDVELENIAGQVTINGAFSGTLDFKNLAKPLQFDGTRGTELSAQAVPGRISMDLGEFSAKDITGPVRLVTRARDIKLEQFTQSVELETERGDIELTPGKLPVASIEARSGAGKIELLLPEKAAFQLDATAQRGDAVNDYGPQIEKAVDGRAATLKSKAGDGPMIKLTANRGWISVRKEGTEPSEVLPDGPRPPKAPKTPKDLRDSEVKM